MPSWVAWKSSEWMKVGLSVTASPQASSTGVAPAKDALAWHASQQSSQQSSQQPQSQSQPQVLQLLQELQPQPVPRTVEQLLQPHPVCAVPQELQPQWLLQLHLPLLQGLQGPQGPV